MHLITQSTIISPPWYVSLLNCRCFRRFVFSVLGVMLSSHTDISVKSTAWDCSKPCVQSFLVFSLLVFFHSLALIESFLLFEVFFLCLLSCCLALFILSFFCFQVIPVPYLLPLLTACNVIYSVCSPILQFFISNASAIVSLFSHLLQCVLFDYYMAYSV